MKYCDPIKRDHFEILLLEVKQLYFKKKYLKCAQKINSFIVEIWDFKNLTLIKKDALTYKRLIDFRIEDYLRKSNIDIF